MAVKPDEVSSADLNLALNGAGLVAPDPLARALLRDHPVPDGVAAVLTTSGSTGAGKHVMVTKDALLAAAEASNTVLGAMNWTCALPTGYIAGLMTLVRAQVAGTRVQRVRADLSDLSVLPGSNAISLVATQLHRALHVPTVVATLRRFDAILIGGSAVAASLLDRARCAGLTLIQTYGMTETCGGCVYDSHPLPGVQIRIAAGRILLSGPQLFSGYLADPQTTAQVLREGWFITSDRGELDDGRLSVTGRVDSVVITGGVNVDLDQAQRRIDEIGAAAALVGVPDPEWGHRIVLVAEPGRSLTQWRSELADRLAPPALPKALVTVAKLPVTERGKLDRVRLAQLVEEIERGDTGPVD